MRDLDGRVAVPLFEGQMLNRFDHRAKTYEGYVGANKYGRKPNLPKVSDAQHADPTFEVEPRYWMFEDVASKRLAETIGDRALVAYRDVTVQPGRNSRSMKAALLFPTPASTSTPILAVPREGALALSCARELHRVRLPGPRPRPRSKHSRPGSCPNAPLRRPKRSTLAVPSWPVSSPSLRSKLAETYSFPLHVWDPEERPFLEAECDARVARSYGLSL